MCRLLASILFIALLAVSCSKGDAVAPCGGHEEDQSGAKSLPTMGAAIVDPDLNASPVSGRPKPPSAGISDDGDDLSNSEKSRKKSR